MNWPELGAIASIMVVVGGALAWHVNAAIRANNGDLVKELDQRFVRREGSQLTGHEIEQRLDTLESGRVTREPRGAW